MKKLLVSMCAGLALMTAVPAIVSATPAAPTTPRIVHGFIGTNTNREGDATVNATCNGTTLSTTSNPGGFYQFHFDSDNCPDGKKVTVTASKDGKTGMAQATVNGSVTSIDVPLGAQPTQAPEMGTWVALAAVAGAGGIVAVARRKQQAANL